ncbi:hypothetical protein [Actibacterium sp. 188UL27-1]|uniref:hypothetical protein n=1 Tax=Actibacterium sp. 188UL27-1 TaxID=2786961 RepID=UPI00195A7B83|nr:hypothetical protein [Actibacterium sp. 188UL27-1]MBM7066701.1 hypothetical protein [Actibacterium sp. 188UL27-1]
MTGDGLIEFSSKRFPPTAGELEETSDEFINPGLFGKELAEFLKAELPKLGYPIGFSSMEDWGYWIEVEHDGDFTLAVCCGSQGDYDAKTGADHLVFVKAEQNLLKRLFRKIDTSTAMAELVESLTGLLQATDGVSDVQLVDADPT